MAHNPPELSVVVPAFEASRTIAQCIRALRSQTLPREHYEIIVVDDASTDDTYQVASREGARVLRLERNTGPGAARNVGVAAARGQLIVFTDADCEPCPDFLADLQVRLRDPRVGGVKGAYRSRQRALVARFVQCEYEQRYERTARLPTIDFVDTSACCFRRADVLRVGGFEPRLRMCEDQEMSFRLARDGVRIEFAPEACTYHLHCEDPLGYVRKKFRIARWKAQVLRLHPSKMLHDSHTPQLVKLQMVLTCAVCLAALACLRGVWRPLVVALSAYVGAIAPFVFHVARRDIAVALIAPGMLFGRDLALCAGLLTGTLDLVMRHRQMRKTTPCAS